MEKIHNSSESGGLTENKTHALIIEHASLAAQFAGSHDAFVLEAITDRLREIEEETGLLPHEIAQRALALYKSQYTKN